MFRSNWFGFDEWAEQGLPIRGTTSTVAVKLYDAAVKQYVYWFDDPAMGGMSHTLDSMIKADPNFVLGQSLAINSQIFGFTTTYYNDDELKGRVDQLQALAEKCKTNISEREYAHAQAVIRMSRMDWHGAAECLEGILDHNPTDMHALLSAYFLRFFTGCKAQNLANITKVYPAFAKNSLARRTWTTVHGIYGFTLEEMGQYKDGEQYVRLGIEREPYDAWAWHSLAHILEMQGRNEEGVERGKHADKWSRGNNLACHNYWHQALFEISNHNIDAAVELFDQQVMPRIVESDRANGISDGASLLVRFSLIDETNRPTLDNEKILRRQNDLFGVVKRNLHQHVMPFHDLHYVFNCLGSGHVEEAGEMLRTLRQSKMMETNEQAASIAANLMDALLDFHREHYASATEKLHALRDSVVHIGGSDAQRDVFNQLLIVSALRSSNVEHRTSLLTKVLTEREAAFEQSDQLLVKKKCLKT